MSSCSWWFAIARWWRADPTYGHEVMRPSWTTGHGPTLQCVRCGRMWRVRIS